MSYLDRVAGTTTSVGTGNLTIASLLGFVSPCAAFPPGTSGVTLCILDPATGAWEVSSCTVIDTDTVSRNALLSSSTGSAIDFGAGTKSVFHDVPASVINDLLSNRPLNGSVITSGVVVAEDYLPVIQSGALKRITIENLLSDIGSATPELSPAAGLSGTDVIAITQDGINEVRTTLAAIADYVAAVLSGTASAAIAAATENPASSMGVTGATYSGVAELSATLDSNSASMSAAGITSSASAAISATADTNSASMSATGILSSAAISATLADNTASMSATGALASAGISATTDDTTSAMSASAGASYTITGYSGNAVNTTIDAAAAPTNGSYKYIAATNGANKQFTTNIYWSITPSPASARCGWGTSPTTPPAEITQVQNNGGSWINGLTPMTHPAAWSAAAYLWVPTGSGTSTWYFWIKPVDGPAQCINPAGTVVSNA